MLSEAIAQVPAPHRRQLLIRGDSAAATHAVLDWLIAQNTTRRRVEYSLGWSIGEPGRRHRRPTELGAVTGADSRRRPARRRWRRRTDRPAAAHRVAGRDAGPAFVTNTPTGAVQRLEVRHRAHARVEDRIRCPRDARLRRLPSRDFAINQACCTAAAVAADLIAWLQLTALDGELAVAEPKRLRYRILHTAVRLARGQRRRWLHIPSTWPWAT